jgi:hypothetical protein
VSFFIDILRSGIDVSQVPRVNSSEIIDVRQSSGGLDDIWSVLSLYVANTCDRIRERNKDAKGIRCQGKVGEAPIIGTRQDGDPAIWQGEHLELLIETDTHSYYQIVINPDGARIEMDRAAPEANAYDWSSQAEVATHVGDDYWSVEMRLPVTPSEEDPLHKIIGKQPFQSPADALASRGLLWYSDLFRKRAGSDDGETTAFSPIGSAARKFHVPLRFGMLYVR